MKAAPLFTQTYAFFDWLLGHMEKGDTHAFQRQTVLETARRLLESVTLTLRGIDTLENAIRADETLALLRLHISLAGDLGLLTRRQHGHAVREMDEIGRQLGGWLKKLEPL